MIQTLSWWAKMTLSRWLFLRIASFIVLQSVQISSHERWLEKSLFALSGHGCCEYSGKHTRLYFFVWKMYLRSAWDASPRNRCLHCKMTHWCLYGLLFFLIFGAWVSPRTCLNVLVIIYTSEMFQNCKKVRFLVCRRSSDHRILWTPNKIHQMCRFLGDSNDNAHIESAFSQRRWRGILISMFININTDIYAIHQYSSLCKTCIKFVWCVLFKYRLNVQRRLRMLMIWLHISGRNFNERRIVIIAIFNYHCYAQWQNINHNTRDEILYTCIHTYICNMPW